MSDPSAIGTSPPATAEPDPPDDPPVICAGSCGLRDGPWCAFSPVKSYAYSPMLSAPTRTAPAASRRATSVASLRAGGRSRLIFEPARVVRPSTSNRFLTANGAPASGQLAAARVAASLGARARGRHVGEGAEPASSPRSARAPPLSLRARSRGRF